MLLSKTPLVRAATLDLLRARPELHDQGDWLYVEDGLGLVGCVGGHAAFLSELVYIDEDGWVRRTSDDTFMNDAPLTTWHTLAREALGIGEELADILFCKWVSRRVAIEALTDLLNRVDEDVIADRVDRSVFTVPLTAGRAFLRLPYRRT